jgi:hypothetical protein
MNLYNWVNFKYIFKLYILIIINIFTKFKLKKNNIFKNILKILKLKLCVRILE